MQQLKAKGAANTGKSIPVHGDNVKVMANYVHTWSDLGEPIRNSVTINSPSCYCVYRYFLNLSTERFF